MEGIKIIDILFLALGAYWLLCGIATLVTGKVYGHGKEMDKYTEDSVRAAAPMFGITNIVLGLTFIASNIGGIVESLKVLADNEAIVLGVGIVISLVPIFFAYKKLIKK